MIGEFHHFGRMRRGGILHSKVAVCGGPRSADRSASGPLLVILRSDEDLLRASHIAHIFLHLLCHVLRYQREYGTYSASR